MGKEDGEHMVFVLDNVVTVRCSHPGPPVGNLYGVSGAGGCWSVRQCNSGDYRSATDEERTHLEGVVERSKIK